MFIGARRTSMCFSSGNLHSKASQKIPLVFALDNNIEISLYCIYYQNKIYILQKKNIGINTNRIINVLSLFYSF